MRSYARSLYAKARPGLRWQLHVKNKIKAVLWGSIFWIIDLLLYDLRSRSSNFVRLILQSLDLSNFA